VFRAWPRILNSELVLDLDAVLTEMILDNGNSDIVRVVPADTGCSSICIIPRKLLARVGLFDETFEGWGLEDGEYAHRIQRLGVTRVMTFTAAVRRSASMTLTEMSGYGPAKVGVPLIRPVDESMVRPGGRLVADHT
jgi:hypothetical protein